MDENVRRRVKISDCDNRDRVAYAGAVTTEGERNSDTDKLSVKMTAVLRRRDCLVLAQDVKESDSELISEAVSLVRSFNHSSPDRGSVGNKSLTIHYRVRNTICCVCVSDRRLPEEKALALLDDISYEFLCDNGDQVEHAAGTHKFIDFGEYIRDATIKHTKAKTATVNTNHVWRSCIFLQVDGELRIYDHPPYVPPPGSTMHTMFSRFDDKEMISWANKPWLPLREAQFDPDTKRTTPQMVVSAYKLTRREPEYTAFIKFGPQADYRPVPLHHSDLVIVGGRLEGIEAAFDAGTSTKTVVMIYSGTLRGYEAGGCLYKMWSLHYNVLKNINEDANTQWRAIRNSRKQHVIEQDTYYQKELCRLGVRSIRSPVFFNDDGDVFADGYRYRGKQTLIAVGDIAIIPCVPGAKYGIDSDGLFEMEKLPKKTVVAGDGYIAVELAGLLATLGSEVHQLIRYDKVLRAFDETLSSSLTEAMHNGPVHLHKNNRVKEIVKGPNGLLTVKTNEGDIEEVDALIWAIGRKPLTSTLNLNGVGVNTDAAGHILVDKYHNTSNPSISCVGDAARCYALPPVAIAAGRRLSQRLPNGESSLKLDYKKIACVVFTHPPVATVGFTEAEAIAKYGKDNVTLYKSKFDPIYYAVGKHKEPSMMKMVCAGPDQRVVGVHLLGFGADERIQVYAVAVSMGATKKQFDNCAAIHPTSAMAEE